MDRIEGHAQNGVDYDGKCFVCHSNCITDAEIVKAELEQHFPKLAGKIRIFDIGTIIASHCGPGTVAVFFIGDSRTSLEKK